MLGLGVVCNLSRFTVSLSLVEKALYGFPIFREVLCIGKLLKN